MFYIASEGRFFLINGNNHDFYLPIPFLFAIADRLTLIRQQRAEAAKKRDEEKAGTYTSLLLLIRCLAFLRHVLTESIKPVKATHTHTKKKPSSDLFYSAAWFWQPKKRGRLKHVSDLAKLNGPTRYVCWETRR